MSNCRALAIAGVALLAASAAARSQELVPRAYVITPTGTNVVATQISRLDGDVDLNGAAPITGANIALTVPTLGLYRALDFFGRSANVSLGLPYGTGELTGTVAGVPRRASLNGFLDSSLRLSVNLLGGDAMTREYSGTGLGLSE